MNDTNPYAAPEYVEEDVPGCDLHKIALLYNRLGVVLKLYVLSIFIYVLGIIFDRIFLESPVRYVGSPSSAIMDITINIFVYLAIIVLVAMVFLWLYSIIVIVSITFAMKLRTPVILLVILGVIYMPVTILVIILLRYGAKQILSTANVVIINGKVDLAQIPVEENY